MSIIFSVLGVSIVQEKHLFCDLVRGNKDEYCIAFLSSLFLVSMYIYGYCFVYVSIISILVLVVSFGFKENQQDSVAFLQ